MRNTSDMRYYEVTLVVALPNYLGGNWTGLDAVAQALRDDSELIMLEMAETEVHLTTKAATPTVVANTVTTTTSTNTVNAIAKKVAKAAKVKTRKRVKAANSHQRWTNKQVLTVMALHSKGVSTKEIAKVTGRSTSAIANAVYVYNKGGK